MQGVGTYIYPDGSVYKGDWKNNQHHGVGVYEFPNGTVYEGEW
jgi:radial spoke head protein 1